MTKFVMLLFSILISAKSMIYGSEFDLQKYERQYEIFKEFDYEQIRSEKLPSEDETESRVAYYQRVRQLSRDVYADADFKWMNDSAANVHDLWRQLPTNQIVVELRFSYAFPLYNSFDYAWYLVTFAELRATRLGDDFKNDGWLNSDWYALVSGMIDVFLENRERGGTPSTYSRKMYLFDVVNTEPSPEDVNLWLNLVDRRANTPGIKHKERWQVRLLEQIQRAENQGFYFRKMEDAQLDQSLDRLIMLYRSYYAARNWNILLERSSNHGVARASSSNGDNVPAAPVAIKDNQKDNPAISIESFTHLLTGDFTWLHHIRLVDMELGSAKPNQMPFNGRYIPAVLAEQFGEGANLLTKCAEALYNFKLSARFAGPVGDHHRKAMGILASLSVDEQQELDEKEPGLLSALLSIGHGMSGDQVNSNQFRDIAISFNNKWADFIKDNIVIWEKVEK